MKGRGVYWGEAALCASLFVMAFILGDIPSIFQGFYTILTSQCVLITDYMALAGPAAAYFNAALVTLITISILRLAHDPTNGTHLAVVGLAAGFAFFGKNPGNMAPILAGTWLFAKVKGEKFCKYAPVGLMATALGPMVSFFALEPDWGGRLLGIGVGLFIGFVLPTLAAHTFRIQRGMNLYNMGFACGMLALVTMPVVTALGRAPTSTLLWSTQYQLSTGIFVAVLSAACIVAGSILGGKDAWAGYKSILRTTGQAPVDYLLDTGGPPVLISMGVNGLAALCYIQLMGWDLNGPMLGGILSIMGFSACGKHIKNILPIMAGVALGGALLHDFGKPAVQLAGLFGTCLAPISGCFGVVPGVLAGFLHSAIVLRAGVPAEGLNLYNNGFSAGLLSIVFTALFTPFMERRAKMKELSDDSYYQVILEEEPPPEEVQKVAEVIHLGKTEY